MEIVDLGLDRIEELLELERQMYWQKGDWKNLWEREAKEKFRDFIKDYLSSFPEGCFGLTDGGQNLLGAMFLIKLSKVKPIPYLHKVSDYLEKNGKIAYVSLFVVKRGKREFEVAQKIYDYAEKVAFFKLKCKTISVVIYSSPTEKKALMSHNYEKLDEQFEWEIYPDKKVLCHVYYYNLLMEACH